MFGLIDCNNFYVSCQRVFEPKLNKRKVVVLSNNDGCVISRSNDVKALIPMGAPIFKYKQVVKKHNVAVISANFALYGDMSTRVMDVISQLCYDIEVYSIDECFIDLSGFDYNQLLSQAKQIVQRVQKWLGLPVSIGIAPTKALAKVANRIVKKHPSKTNGIYLLDNPEKITKSLQWLKVGDIWGIGPRLAKRLNDEGVYNAHQFINVSDYWVKNNLSIVGLRLKRELQSISTLKLEKVAAKKSIATTRTFDQDYTSLGQLQERVITFAVSCAEKLREQNSLCRSMLLFIHTNQYKSKDKQYMRNIFIQLPFSTSSNIELAKIASKAMAKIYKKGYRYKRAGVVLQDIHSNKTQQLTLWGGNDTRHIPLMQAVDKINHKFGDHTIHLAAQNRNQKWKMRQLNLSPCYTTNLNDIIKIYC